MSIEIKIPSVGESVTEAFIDSWAKEDGDTVEKNELILVIETEKVALEIEAQASGTLHIFTPVGERVAIGAVVGRIDIEAADVAEPARSANDAVVSAPTAGVSPGVSQGGAAAPPAAPAGEAVSVPITEPTASTVPAAPIRQDHPLFQQLTPTQRREVRALNISLNAVKSHRKDGVLTVADLLLHMDQLKNPAQYADATTESPKAVSTAMPASSQPRTEAVERRAISPMRQRIAQRLLEAKRNTAMLTTFNEVDMSRVMAMRSRYKDLFHKKHDVNLGFMSFFIKAVTTAMESCPDVNAYMTETEIIRHRSVHMGVAIGSDRGLVVPVIRQAEQLGFAQLEQAIVDYVAKIKANQLTLADMEGGTFTITNGGIYGSLMSTPILNPPQSGILGMHAIKKRPVVVDDQIVIRPMMNLALSYDHRVIDGKGAVTFLVRIKESIENPERMMLAL